MKKISFWKRLKHIFGFHTWGETAYWYVKGEDRWKVYGMYVNCKICGYEKVIKYPY